MSAHLFEETADGGYRYDDPFTCEEAAVAQIGRKASNQRRALDALYRAENGATDFELAAMTGIQQTSIGKRRGELRDAGLVRAMCREDGTTLTRPSPSGSSAIVWCLTARGIVEATSRGGVDFSGPPPCAAASTPPQDAAAYSPTFDAHSLQVERFSAAFNQALKDLP